jgi:hypothetical protein
MMKGSRAMKSLERARVRAIGLSTTAALAALVISATPAVAEPSEHPFEIVPGSFHFSPSSDQAGAHADWVTSFDFAHEADGAPFNDVRNVLVEFPAGFDGSNTAVPTCSEAQLLATNSATPAEGLPDCPLASQIGDISLEVFPFPNLPVPYQLTIPVYDMEVSGFGVAAEFGFNVQGTVIDVTPVSLRPGDSGITVISPNIERLGEVRNATVTTWGCSRLPRT